MSEAEWLACGEPQTLLEFASIQTTARKCRLVAASFCRHVLPLTTEKCGHRAVEIAEQYADGLAGLEEMLAVSEQVADAYVNFPNPAPVNTEPSLSHKAESVALQSTRFLTWDGDDWLVACCRCTYLATLRWALRVGPDGAVAPYSSMSFQWQLSLIRDVNGNPFHPVAVNPAWLSPKVRTLAQTIYADRAFDKMPALADALQEAGCDNEDIVSHCRGPGPHVKGCWVVDLVLGKE